MINHRKRSRFVPIHFNSYADKALEDSSSGELLAKVDELLDEEVEQNLMRLMEVKGK